MKAVTRAVLCLTVLLAGSLARAYPGFAEDDGAPYKTAHYEIYGGDGEAAERTALDLEGRFDVFTRLFRFKAPARPLKVRLIPGKGAYDDYVAGHLGETREGAVYFHYRQENRRELVIHTGPEAESAGTDGRGHTALPYQAFIQYLRAFVPNPPSWIQKGFAVYFSGLSFSEAGELRYQENLAWLETVKAEPPPPAGAILLADIADVVLAADADPEGGKVLRVDPSGPGFDALAWSLASFFLNSGNEDYFRSLLECFRLLSPEAGAAENSLALVRWIVDWNGLENLDRDYRAYLESRRTFPGLMEKGRQAYLSGEDGSAFFREALELRPGHYAPLYYLGLIAYGRGNWEEAEGYFTQSLEGGDPALVYYALGLNAAAALNRDKAQEYLDAAVKADPGRYREKAEVLLKRLLVR
jgi:tetratricopeptide (TPR) repeat protein